MQLRVKEKDKEINGGGGGDKREKVQQREGRLGLGKRFIWGDCTFSNRSLQQVVFGLQLGDEITALQKLPEFLWRVESNYSSGSGCPKRRPLRKQSALRHPTAGEGRAKSPVKASFFSVFLFINRTICIVGREEIFWPRKAEIFRGSLASACCLKKGALGVIFRVHRATVCPMLFSAL